MNNDSSCFGRFWEMLKSLDLTLFPSPEERDAKLYFFQLTYVLKTKRHSNDQRQF
jgi:hypothetical protein